MECNVYLVQCIDVSMCIVCSCCVEMWRIEKWRKLVYIETSSLTQNEVVMLTNTNKIYFT